MKREPLEGPSVWLGRDMAHSPRWIADFSPAALVEIDAALSSVKQRDIPWAKVTRQDFARPALIAQMHQDVAAAKEILNA